MNLVFATDQLCAKWDFGNNSNGYNLTLDSAYAFPNSDFHYQATADTFNATYSGALIKIRVMLFKAGSPSLNVHVALYGCGNTLGNSPNGTVLATSSTVVAASSLTTTAQVYDFVFDGSYNLVAGMKYAYVIYISDVSVNGNPNWVLVPFNRQSSYGGDGKYFASNAWSSMGDGADLTFEVYTSPTPEPTPTPTPTPTTRYGWTITPNVTFNLYDWGLKSNLVQGQGYTYTGNIISNSTPYGDGNYSYYTTGVKNNLNDAVTDLLAKTVNFNATGTYNINYAGTFSFYITPQYVQGSGNTYQGYLVNGTIRQTGETFESITIIDASEPTNDIRIYLTGGTFVNHELLTTVNFNQVNFGVTYTANGRLFLGSLLTGNYTYYLATTILTSSQLTAKNELFTNVSYGNVQNGIFQFVLSPRTYSSFPLYQGLQITINGTQKTFWIEFIGTVNGLFSSNPATANPNEFGGGMSAQMIQWLIMMLLMFIPVLGVTLFVAIHTHSGSATALTFFGATLIDVVIGVLIGFIDWWVIIIVGVFLIIAAYAQFGKVTTGG